GVAGVVGGALSTMGAGPVSKDVAGGGVGLAVTVFALVWVGFSTCLGGVALGACLISSALKISPSLEGSEGSGIKYYRLALLKGSNAKKIIGRVPPLEPDPHGQVHVNHATLEQAHHWH